MQQLIPRRLALLAAMPALLLLWSCQQDVQTTDDGSVKSGRAPVDSLDRDTADARKARISNLEYEALIDLVSSEDEFSGDVTLRFDLADATTGLTIDFTGGSVIEMLVNDAQVVADYNGYFITIPADKLQSGSNSVQITYIHPYTGDGTGLHHFVDPEDGQTYLYTYLWPYYANRLLPSFDQPNLKATFAMKVLAPEDWTVVSMSPGSSEPANNGSNLWTFGTTPKISTYAFSLHAGPYAVWEDNSGDVPLRLFARQSLAEYVAVDEWFELTQKGMRFYGRYFDIPYPFEKYDQLIVPEFNIGGMENAAAVTFAESYVQRQESDRAQRENRAGTVLHELAHMWFGDLVTHEWWNGMWLNESFATQMAALAKIEVTEFDDTWHGFFTEGKKRAFQRDSRVTTHPIEQVVDATDEFYMLFDGITYQKGASALKQLQHLVGADNYRLGVSAYLKENSYGTTELSDFIGHQEKSAGAYLGDWSDEWLLKPGFNTLAVEIECEDESLHSLAIIQSAPEDHPYLRMHRVDVALYDIDNDGALVAGDILPVQIEGARTEVAVPPGRACPLLVNPNHNDWTFAKIALRDEDAVVLREQLGDIEAPMSRSMFLAALFDKAMSGDMPVADYVRQALRLAETEENMRVLEQIASSLAEAAGMMKRLRPETDKALPRLLDDIEALGLRRSHFAQTQDLKYMWLNMFLNVVSSNAGVGTARALLDGRAEIDGIEISPEIRWRLLTILSRHGAPDIAKLLEEELSRDPSDFGARSALSVRAAVPDAAVKERWLAELQNPQSTTGLARQRAVMHELFPANQTNLQLEVLPIILGALPQMSVYADPYFMRTYTESLLTPMCQPESTALMQAALDDYAGQLNPTTLRFLREAHQADMECLSIRAAQ
jgi:aminopeptidase N